MKKEECENEEKKLIQI